MMIGMFVFFYRQQEWGVAWSAVLVGLFGGLGFSGAALIKLVLMHPGFQERLLGVQVTANWHSVLEQTFGFISGIGVALALGYLSTHTARVSEEPPVPTWAEPATILFVLLAVTYVNIVKNVDKMWLPHKVVADHLLGIATITWFNLAYAVLAVAVAWPLVVACRGRSLDILPASRLGKAQLLYIVLLWWIVIGNFTRMVDFQELRLVTEGVVHFNACVCTLLVILLPRPERTVGEIVETNYLLLLKRFVASAILMSLILIVAEVALTQALWGDGQAPTTRQAHPLWAGQHERGAPVGFRPLASTTCDFAGSLGRLWFVHSQQLLEAFGDRSERIELVGVGVVAPQLAIADAVVPDVGRIHEVADARLSGERGANRRNRLQLADWVQAINIGAGQRGDCKPTLPAQIRRGSCRRLVQARQMKLEGGRPTSTGQKSFVSQSRLVG